MTLSAIALTCSLDTEIDWKAYMEEVEGFLSGERDYSKIQGNTGPLVYPAGFLYIFSALRAATENGSNIFLAQLIFVGVYLTNLLAVFVLYLQSGQVELILSVCLVLSKRIHSIYMLRMFNAHFINGFCCICGIELCFIRRGY